MVDPETGSAVPTPNDPMRGDSVPPGLGSLAALAARAANEDRSRLRRTLQIETVGVILFRLDGTVADANDAFLRMSGYDRGDLDRGQVRWDTMTPPEWMPLYLRAIDELIVHGRTTPYEKECLRKDGSRWWALFAATRLDGGEGVEFVVDITETKRAEAAVRAGEERYRALFDAIDQGFCVVEVLFDAAGRSVDYRFEETNPAFERQTGLGAATGKTARELVPGLEAHWFETYGKVAATGEPARFVNEAKPMGGRWFDVSAFRLGGDGSARVAILFTDISDRKRTEEALRESEERFRTLIERSADAVQLVTPEGRILYSSDSVEAVLGYRPEEIEGHAVAADVHPDDREGVLARLASVAAAAGAHATLEYRVRHKDGTWAWVETTFANHLATPSIGAIVGNFRNVTARKELERQKDEFVAVATHELKTPVTSLKGYAQLLRNRFRKAGDEASATLMERMDGQTDRLVALIGDLLDATKIEAGQLRLTPEAVAVDGLADAIAAELQLTTDRHRILRLGQAGAPIVADRDRTGQVLINLLSNAITYSPDAGEITVTTADEGDGVRVCVRDQGPGIPAAQQGRLFERFYRGSGSEEPGYAGLGLGLYISAEIVRRHGGQIWVESAVGQGSTFCFWLPRQPAEDRAAGEGTPAA